MTVVIWVFNYFSILHTIYTELTAPFHTAHASHPYIPKRKEGILNKLIFKTFLLCDHSKCLLSISGHFIKQTAIVLTFEAKKLNCRPTS